MAPKAAGERGSSHPRSERGSNNRIRGDVTEVWLSRYERLFERYTRLIETYEQRERETTLGQNLKFTE